MSKRYEMLPPQLRPRGLTRGGAAAYAGISPTQFDQARKNGKYPNPTLPGERYDLRALEIAMNKLSGIEECEANALDAWRKKKTNDRG